MTNSMEIHVAPVINWFALDCAKSIWFRSVKHAPNKCNLCAHTNLFDPAVLFVVVVVARLFTHNSGSLSTLLRCDGAMREIVRKFCCAIDGVLPPHIINIVFTICSCFVRHLIILDFVRSKTTTIFRLPQAMPNQTKPKPLPWKVGLDETKPKQHAYFSGPMYTGYTLLCLFSVVVNWL